MRNMYEQESRNRNLISTGTYVISVQHIHIHSIVCSAWHAKHHIQTGLNSKKEKKLFISSALKHLLFFKVPAEVRAQIIHSLKISLRNQRNCRYLQCKLKTTLTVFLDVPQLSFPGVLRLFEICHSILSFCLELNAILA